MATTFIAAGIEQLWPFLAILATAIVTYFATRQSSWENVAKRLQVEKDQLEKKLSISDKKVKLLQRDYLQVLEFNYQDRWVIRELGFMVRDFRKELKLPATDILLDLYEKAQAQMEMNRPDLMAGIHSTIERLEEE